VEKTLKLLAISQFLIDNQLSYKGVVMGLEAGVNLTATF